MGWLDEAVGGLMSMFSDGGGDSLFGGGGLFSLGSDTPILDSIGAANTSPGVMASFAPDELPQGFAGTNFIGGDPALTPQFSSAAPYTFDPETGGFGSPTGSNGMNPWDFGALSNGAFSGANLLKGWQDWLPGAGSGGLGGGGGNVSMPAISSPVAERIGASPVSSVPTSPVPQTPAPANDFKPMTLDTAPRGADSGGLARIFQELAARQDPFADARPRGR